MRAAVLEEYGEPLSIEDVDRPEPDPDGVVVETYACGVCRSDWHAWQGDWHWVGVAPQRGQILGHEPAGEVVAVGDDVERRRGVRHRELLHRRRRPVARPDAVLSPPRRCHRPQCPLTVPTPVPS